MLCPTIQRAMRRDRKRYTKLSRRHERNLREAQTEMDELKETLSIHKVVLTDLHDYVDLLKSKYQIEKENAESLRERLSNALTENTELRCQLRNLKTCKADIHDTNQIMQSLLNFNNDNNILAESFTTTSTATTPLYSDDFETDDSDQVVLVTHSGTDDDNASK